MIVSTLHNFIFVAIPKTATHSVRQALRAHLGPQDMEQVGLFVDKKFPMRELALLQHGHLTLAQVRPYLPDEHFDRSFKFAFVRNPFDRFVSYCAFFTRHSGRFERDPKGVMRHLIANPPLAHVLFQPQYSFVTSPQGEMLADMIGRVEEMQQSYDRIAARIGIPTTMLDKVNSSKRRDYHEYYDDEIADGVAKLYARDLQLFGYQF